jgi:hypothetical protein
MATVDGLRGGLIQTKYSLCITTSEGFRHCRWGQADPTGRSCSAVELHMTEVLEAPDVGAQARTKLQH